MQNADRFGYSGPKRISIHGKPANSSVHGAPNGTTERLPSNSTRMNPNALEGSTNATNTKFATFSAHAAETPVDVTARAATEYHAVG